MLVQVVLDDCVVFLFALSVVAYQLKSRSGNVMVAWFEYSAVVFIMIH